eukprot:6184262-Pleurochrysis_carterae.AAC.1
MLSLSRRTAFAIFQTALCLAERGQWVPPRPVLLVSGALRRWSRSWRKMRHLLWPQGCAVARCRFRCWRERKIGGRQGTCGDVALGFVRRERWQCETVAEGTDAAAVEPVSAGVVCACERV